MPTAKELRATIAKQSGQSLADVNDMTKKFSIPKLQGLLGDVRAANAANKAAAEAAAQVARQGGTKAQAIVAGQAAAQAVQAQAMGGTRPSGGGKSKKSLSSRTPSSPGRKSAKSSRLAKSSSKSKPVTISKTKKGGRGRDPSKAKNMDVLRKSLTKMGVDPARLKNKSRAALQQMVRYQYQKGKSIKGGGTTQKSKLPQTYVRDYARIRKLLGDGTLPVRTRAGKQVLGVGDIPLSDTKARYEAFFETYAPAIKQAKLLTGRGKMGAAPKKSKSRKSKSKSGGRKSVAKRFSAIKQQGKVPYYLAKGSVRRIGGGPSGPGVVRVIPGSKATPFNKLSDAEKRRVLNYLNSENGKSLRGPGAKRAVDVQGVINLKANEKAARQAARARAKSKSKSRKAS
jgi:hypothetical protein